MVHRWSVVIAAALFAGGVAGPAGVASAAGLTADPTLTYFQCGNFGRGSYGCTAEITAQATPQIRWVVNGSPMPQFDNELFMGGGCDIGQLVTIQITVSNVNGTVTARYPVWCSGEADG